ncbi:MAG TPA: SDR family NAD(P)-dependent oxidoreductase [Verrucomicrobiae bacterium]|nr:SDR family NAD(P)-dependent oxidoreductase [Verrucomicrobiae bacterium]
MRATEAETRVVLITGAAGGLGRGLATEFAAQGWRVAAAYHRSDGHGETDLIWPVQLDVTDGSQALDVVRQLMVRWGRIDVLINNAGLTADNPLWQTSDEDWDRVLEVNLKGAFLCSQAVLRPMLSRQDGHIINIASFAARHGPRGQANYAAAKAGLIGLTESLAKEVGSRNIRVNAVLPGVLPTPMTAKLAQPQLNEFASANALGRLNTVAEVARFVAFLATTRNVSGQSFPLDSRTARWT